MVSSYRRFICQILVALLLPGLALGQSPSSKKQILMESAKYNGAVSEMLVECGFPRNDLQVLQRAYTVTLNSQRLLALYLQKHPDNSLVLPSQNELASAYKDGAEFVKSKEHLSSQKCVQLKTKDWPKLKETLLSNAAAEEKADEDLGQHLKNNN